MTPLMEMLGKKPKTYWKIKCYSHRLNVAMEISLLLLILHQMKWDNFFYNLQQLKYCVNEVSIKAALRNYSPKKELRISWTTTTNS